MELVEDDIWGLQILNQIVIISKASNFSESEASKQSKPHTREPVNTSWFSELKFSGHPV